MTTQCQKGSRLCTQRGVLVSVLCTAECSALALLGGCIETCPHQLWTQSVLFVITPN